MQRHSIFFVVFACFSAASICFCYFVAKRKPGFELGLTVLAVNFALLSINGLASFVFNLQNFWTDTIQMLNRFLLPLGTAILFWQGAKKSKEEKREKIKKMESDG
jgi:TRAP-type C4-dicarboxylate transport system permease large subunit